MLLRRRGNVTAVNAGSNVLGSSFHGSSQHPFPLAVFIDAPTNVVQFNQGTASYLAAFLDRFGIGGVGPDVGAERVQFHAALLARVYPAA